MNKIILEDLKNICDTQVEWSKLKNKKILITGANGSIASYLVRTILYLNDNFFGDNKCIVHALIRNRERAEFVFKDYLNRNDFYILEQDVTKHLKVDVCFDYIIHAASQASPKYYKVDPVGTLAANIIGSYNLLNHCIDNKPDCFLYLSSGEVYGKVDENIADVKEDSYGYLDPLELKSCYGESKRMAENMCIAWANQYGINTKIVRISHTYGPEIRLDDERVYADFVNDIVNNRNIRLKSDGMQSRPFCYVSDAVTGIFTVMFKGANNNAYNLGNPDCTISIKNLAELLVGLWPDKNLKVEYGGTHSENYMRSNITGGIINIQKLRQIGWKPTVSIEEGFKRTVESFEKIK